MSPSSLETTVFISNLHCASCVQTIEGALSSISPPPLSIDVSIISQSVTVRHDPRLSAALIEAAIEDAGFDISNPHSSLVPSISDSISDLFLLRHSKHVAQCTLCKAERQPTGPSNDVSKHTIHEEKGPFHSVPLFERGPYILVLSIGGMTCAACSTTVTRLVSEVNGVLDVAVDLIGHSGKVTIKDKSLSDTVVQTIEDAGYDAEVVNTEPHSNHIADDDPVPTRTVSLRVDGMFCRHCPNKVMAALESLDNKVTILKAVTSNTDPILKLSYSPVPPVFTIRTIISAISSSQSPPFNVSIHNPPTLEERAQVMRSKERRKLLQRLGFSVITAIPTFIIGIVYMSLVPNTDSSKTYLMGPMWSGMASRAEWALFFLATPVMFYSAGLFHQRSIKEIRALWRRGSKTPVWKRFVRFGSMNLLVSAGVSVAYFSSIVLLALAASQSSSNGHGQGDITTYFDSVVFLTMFLLAGRFLEAYSKGRTADAVSSLGKLRPSQALLLSPTTTHSNFISLINSLETDIETGNPDADSLGTKLGITIETVDPRLLEVGDVVRVPHGSSPPADGTIVAGETFFDESSLTGESKPVRKAVNDQVFLGTINQGRVVETRIDVIGGQTILDKVVEIVREGQTHRAPIERVADVITGYFVPIVTLLAIVTWLVWLILGFSGSLPRHYLNNEVGGWTVWSLQFSIAVFVVACPCGIGLAAPTALLVGSGLAAKFGILVRGGGEAFQECAQLDVVVFDKTGTLTEGGQPQVTDVEFAEGRWSREKLLRLAYEIESASSHPIAEAIRSYCKANGGKPISISEIEETPGKGMKACVSNSPLHEVIIGNATWMADHQAGITDDLRRHLESWQEQGKSIVVMAVRDDRSFMPAVAFAIADSLRSEAKAVVSRLQYQGLGIWMLSGDNSTTAKAVARSVGILENNVIADVLPHEKAEKIQWLQRTGSKRLLPRWRSLFGKRRLNERCIVAMVGDGINDAAALTAADVGIAIGSGSDVAISSASFILLSSNLKTLLTLTDLSSTVFNRVKINFLWAGIYNIIAVPIAAGVIYPIGNARLNPVWASLAMALSSVSVVCSSLALKLYREPKVSL